MGYSQQLFTCKLQSECALETGNPVVDFALPDRCGVDLGGLQKLYLAQYYDDGVPVYYGNDYYTPYGVLNSLLKNGGGNVDFWGVPANFDNAGFTESFENNAQGKRWRFVLTAQINRRDAYRSQYIDKLATRRVSALMQGTNGLWFLAGLDSPLVLNISSNTLGVSARELNAYQISIDGFGLKSMPQVSDNCLLNFNLN